MDAAAGDETAPLDARALASGAGVVLSNKAPLALPLNNPLAAELWAAAGPGGICATRRPAARGCR